MSIHNLRLAQLIAHKSKAEIIVEEILEDGYIDYQLPVDFIQNGTQMQGCTALHIVVKDLNVKAAERLVDYGANCTIKNSLGETALHQAIIALTDTFSNKLSGPLYNSIIYNILHSHSFHQDSDNPCNNNGLSHFHAACIVNYDDIVQFFLEKDVPVNDAVNVDSPYAAGYTGLHFAVRYSCFETFKLLLHNGGDLHKQDAKGWTPLDLLIHSHMKLSYIVHIKRVIFKDFSDDQLFIKSLKMMKQVLDHCRRGKIDLLEDAGLSYTHIACVSQDISHIVQLVRDKNTKINRCIRMNSRLWPGYTPLHFAAHCGISTVDVLLKEGANILAKDANGITPFDLCIQRYEVDGICTIINYHESWRCVKLSNEITSILDMVQAMKNKATLEIFLQNVPIDVHVPTSSPLWPGCTFLHVAIMLTGNTTYLEKIKVLLDAGADVAVSDSHGSTPIHLAFHLHQSKVVSLLLQQLRQPIENVVDAHNISHLHVACAASNTIVATRMIAISGSNVNLPLKSNYEFQQENGRRYFFTAGSTPLHIAVVTRNEFVIEYLSAHGADVNAKDFAGFTPIHRLLTPNQNTTEILHIGTLLFRLFSSQNRVTSFGLSHLHIACWTKNESAVEKLLDQGAGINASVKTIARTPQNNLAYKQLQELSSFIGYTAINFALRVSARNVINIIFRRCNNIHGYPKSVLAAACYTKKSASISEFLRTHKPTMESWTKTWNFTPLHAACCRSDIGAVRELLKQGANPNDQISSKSPSFPGLTPLHILMDLYYVEEKKMYGIIKLLLDHGADVTMRNPAGNTVVHEHLRVFRMKRKPTLLLLLNSQKNFCMDTKILENLITNPAIPLKEISNFHAACACNAVPIVEKYLKDGADVNQIINPLTHPFEGYTPLHLAALYNAEETVKLLISYKANVNARNRDDETPLHCAVNYNDAKFSNNRVCESTVSALLSAGAEFTARNVWGDTPLEVLLKTQKPTSHLLSVLSKDKRYMNKFFYDDTGYMARAIKNEAKIKKIIEHPIFQTLIIHPRINKIQSGRTPVHNIVSIKKVAAPIQNYIKAIEEMLKVGINIDQQDRKGQTALHIAVRFGNTKGVAAMLALGANINLFCNGETPFTYHWKSIGGTDPDRAKFSKNDLRILMLLSIQVYKLQLIKFDVSSIDKITEAALALRRWSINLTVVEKCRDELERLEYRKIEPYNITLSGFLSETGTISSYPEMTQQKREAIFTFFEKRSFRLRREFPQFAGILRMQHRKAVARMALCQPAKEALASLLNYSLPDLCSSSILLFLTNSELQKLIDSQDLASPMVKRRRTDYNIKL